jgi:hypothetical protein
VLVDLGHFPKESFPFPIDSGLLHVGVEKNVGDAFDGLSDVLSLKTLETYCTYVPGRRLRVHVAHMTRSVGAQIMPSHVFDDFHFQLLFLLRSLVGTREGRVCAPRKSARQRYWRPIHSFVQYSTVDWHRPNSDDGSRVLLPVHVRVQYQRRFRIRLANHFPMCSHQYVV